MSDQSVTVKEISDASFGAEVISSPIPVIVDFWAPWCGPCKAFAPLFAEVASEYSGKVTFAKLNVDDNTEIAAKFAVRSIPTLILFVGGEKKAEIMGRQSKPDLKKFIDDNMSRGS